ncbi:PREDICTED: exportin-2-like [Rhagoletis zephyria]|uniref:exportin-2-like n=1 Tax=Rhagoletis zephyria TaxID=28612 RepID=UPI0008116594|nr:PREDICTED: exportin-2-like [Rhagoletis zephyria]
MFVMVVEKLFIVDAQKVLGSTDRKTLAVGITKLLTELDVFFTNTNMNALWAPLLPALVSVFALPEDESTEGAEHFVEIEKAAGYQASYSQPATHTGRKQLDPMEDIADARIFLATSLGKLSAKYPLKTIVLSMQADAVAFL